jgi:hypothetical protein
VHKISLRYIKIVLQIEFLYPSSKLVEKDSVINWLDAFARAFIYKKGNSGKQVLV